MPVDPLQNLINEIKDLKRRLKTLETAPSQQNMTVDKGATRILSDEGLQVGSPGSSNGSAIVYGVLTIVGTMNGDGTVDWEGTINQLGPTNLRGPVKITGEDGTLEVDAETLLRGLTRILADLNVESDGKITVEGTDPIVLQQEGGQAKIKVGTTGEIAGSDAGIQMMVAGDPNRRVLVTPDAIRLIGVTNAASDAVPDFWLGIQLDGTLRRYSPGSGGPMGGDFDWPFSLSLVTSEYGMRIHPITGVETMHNGIDFGAPNGANIPAASGGTVLTVGSDSGRGNYVVLSHANDVQTHYFHMLSMPAVIEGQVVSKGTTLGQVGNTGASTAPHLHFEVHVDGSPINPRDFAGLD